MNATPLYFGPAERPLFGWLHARSPSSGSSRSSRSSRSASGGTGLVVCNPFGYEAICAHRSLRHFAEAAAAAGIPSLRFDYDGTGDSAGDDRDPGRLAAWVASVAHAIDFLRTAANVEHVTLLGVRFGALIATLAAAQRNADKEKNKNRNDKGINGIIAIAPVVSGKTYLREVRALQGTLSRGEPPSHAVVEEGMQEALGFVLTPETQAALGQVDLARLEACAAPSVLVIERDDLTTSSAWPDRLASQGATVDRRRLPGYVEMMLGPQDALVPEAMVRAATDWLCERSERGTNGDAARVGSGDSPPAQQEESAPPRFVANQRARFGGEPSQAVIESAESIAIVAPHRKDTRAKADADARRLFGVLSAPENETTTTTATSTSTTPQPSRRRRGILLLNPGSVHHIGSNRLYVTLARRWAALGHVVLRMDIAGIGDSRPRPGEPENIVYTTEATADVASALAFLRSQPGVAEVHAVGLCSGGYHAFKAAVADVPLDGVVLINPLTFFYKPGMSLAPYHVAFETTRYVHRLRSLDAWKKLLRGDVKLGAARRVFTRRLENLMRDAGRDVARRAGIRIEDDLAFELQSVVEKKIALRFLFASGDPGVTLLATQGGRTAKKLRRRGQIGVDIIEGADHTFTPLWSHPLFIASLAAIFDAPLP